jgi:hypothetical protein
MNNTYKHLELMSDDLSLEHYKELLILRGSNDDACFVIMFLTNLLKDCEEFVPSDLRNKIEAVNVAVKNAGGGE